LIILTAITAVSLFVGVFPSYSSSFDIPDWIRGVAGFWAEEKITDDDFGEALTFLIENEIIVIPQIEELRSQILELENENAGLREQLANLDNNLPPPLIQSSEIDLSLSKTSYKEGETIVISGRVATIIDDAPFTIHIFNQGNLIEIAQLVVAQDGSFTHTIIAQGPQWQNEGDYTVRASYGESNITETNFEFFKQLAIIDTSDFFEVDAGSSGTFDVEYIIRGGTVKDMIVDFEMFALVVIIESTSDGNITLDLPRESIDAKKSDGSDDIFIITIDDMEVSYEELITNEKTRTITIQFEQGDSNIKILGTFIVS